VVASRETANLKQVSETALKPGNRQGLAVNPASTACPWHLPNGSLRVNHAGSVWPRGLPIGEDVIEVCDRSLATALQHRQAA